MLLVGLGHVLVFGRVSSADIAAGMRRHAPSIVEDLHRGGGKADLDLLVDQRVRNRVVVLVDFHVVVDVDFGVLPVSMAEALWRQGLEQRFEIKKQAYLDFCDLAKVGRFRRKALSYLLAAAADYLKSHPSERQIIRYLRQADAVVLNERLGQRGKAPVDTLLADAGIPAFDSFSCLLFRLLADPEDDELAAFIAANPAVYDVHFDRFD